ncbi:AAA family ATPase [Parapedobacter sp. ISTM3]|uniref:ATP-dependent DNA helicase n=1 Tax=Parapedobacter sp. ISTM3 TaxID=2800130 RepID=UPI001906EE7C|nr:ATP-dependent DNA helicase [Parapedobacter sp. ISTM3]MBK1442747.1 AAA family ATPase [Parapedobacter sp. ISTM3]
MITIDNIKLDESNEEFFLASELVKYGHPLIYLTGKAGTGKTTFLKYLRQTTEKNTIVLAFTGVAAMNAGGQTINSFFKIPFGPFVPSDKRLRTKVEEGDPDRSTIYHCFQYNREMLKIINGLELLIIDEVSMVRCDLLDVIDRLLRVYRKRENEAFGGVQVILIGDTFQLPPIDKEWHVLEPFYDSIFFFSSKVILKNKPIYIELKKIYRQNEKEFIDLLNRIRVNQVSDNELNLINSKYNPSFRPSLTADYITLATHNNKVESINLTNLAELPGQVQLFEGAITGDFPDNILPTEKTLQLKEGAQIMFIKNVKTKSIYNGKIAKINKIDGNRITVLYEDKEEGELELIIEKQVWKNIRYNWNDEENKIEEEEIGTFTQFPIKLAWAITIHKSQGLTFERVIVDVGNAFASGQVYVALSRCTSFNGLILNSKITKESIIVDSKVIEFAENETPSTLIVEELKSGKADFYYKKAREEIKALNFANAYDNFVKAIKFRNDIETELFKKYFVTVAGRLSSYGSKYNREKEQNHLFKAKHTYLQSRISELEQENQRLAEKNDQQNNAVKTLLDQTASFEKQIHELQREKDDLTLKNNGLNIEISEVKSNYFESKAKIRELEDTLGVEKNMVHTLTEQVQKLESRKWYEVLLNSKK